MSDNDLSQDSFEDDLARFRELAKSAATENHALDEPSADLWTRIEQAVAENNINDEQWDESLSGVNDAKDVFAFSRARKALPALIAIAASLVLIVAGAVTLRWEAEDEILREVVMSNEGLDPAGGESLGAAKLVKLDNGAYGIKLDLTGVPKPDAGYLELWAIDTQVKGMVSLGPFEGNGVYRLPSGIDPKTFPVVDISIEPPDGVPTHSGVSILRGQLT